MDAPRAGLRAACARDPGIGEVVQHYVGATDQVALTDKP
jgi:hypothetical protein